MKRYLHAVLILCLLSPLGIKADDHPSHLFVFGDSLSDTGNLAAFRDINVPPLISLPPQPIGTLGLCNPIDIFVKGQGCGDLFFEKSRVSNGPVAVEVMAERLGLAPLRPSLFFVPIGARPFSGTNYAVAGAVAGESELGDLDSQVGGFFRELGENPAPSDALYVIIIGGNDVIDAVDAAADALQGKELGEDATPKAIIAAAVDGIETNIERLIARGALDIMVATAPNIGALPAIRAGALEADLPERLVTGAATAITIKFNRKLARRLNRIQARHDDDSVTIKRFDLFGYFETVRFLARLFGLNTVDACFDTETYSDFSMLMAVREFDPGCEPAAPGDAPGFDKFVFFDDIHPTGRIHAAIGKVLARDARRLLDD